MGRPRTGRVERRKNGKFFARILLEDGSTSSRIDLDDARTIEEARVMARAIQAREDRTKTLYAAALEERALAKGMGATMARAGTVDAWWERFISTKEVGAGHRRIERSSWRKWVSPVIGKLAMVTLRPEDIERVRDRLDAAIKASKITSGTAENIWSTVTTAMTAATNTKDKSLRVHVPPHYPRPVHTGILPPTGGRDRARPFLYPNEWLRLAACVDVPAERRRRYALALYTGLRPGELRVLTYDDLEHEAGLVRVNKAWDIEEREVKETKTIGGHRVVPFRPEIRHLVQRPAGVTGRGLVVDDNLRGAAPQLRADLRLAGVTRARLFTRSATELPIDFRALRDTYATWRAIEGAESYVLRREMGHESLETTDRYIRLASGVKDAQIGRPFPAFGPFEEGPMHAVTYVKEMTETTLVLSDVPPAVSPACRFETVSHENSSGSDCRTRTCGNEIDRKLSAGIVTGEALQPPPIGVVPPAFLLPAADSLASDPVPDPPAPTTAHGAEMRLYDILEREELGGSK
jgi:integrase